VVDGLFGIGLARPIEGEYAELIRRINAFPELVMALDVPSCLDADTGVIHGFTVQADLTASFIAAKPGLYTLDGPRTGNPTRHREVSSTMVA
jgi:NAD(P)H-hydrate repair Nnr-like enzyme with NAD(P)H-hydrate epimerase domain